MNKNLAVIAYANGFTLYHYKSNEPMKDICAPGYFEKIRTLCATGDIIIINASDKTEIKVVKLAKDMRLVDIGDHYA